MIFIAWVLPGGRHPSRRATLGIALGIAGIGTLVSGDALFFGERSCRERGSAPWIGASLGSRFGTFESLAVDRLAAAACGNGITFGRCSVARLKHRLRRNCSFERTRHFGSCDRCRTLSCGLRFDSRFRLLRLLVASPQSRTSRYICLREPGRRCLPRFGSSRRTTYGEKDAA